MNEIERNIVEFIKLGYSLKEISKKLNEPYSQILKLKKQIVQQGEITERDFIDGENNRKKKELQEDETVRYILKYKKQGLTNEEITQKLKNKVKSYKVARVINECIKYGLITATEIEEGKEYRKFLKEMSNPNWKIIIEGVRNGKNDTTIAKDTTVSYEQVKMIKLKLIERGIITQEEIDLARKNKKQNMKEEQVNITQNIDEDEFLSYLIRGKSSSEIKKK